MVGDHAESDIDFFLLAIICRAAAPAASFVTWQAERLTYSWQRAGVFFAAQLFELIENRAEDIGFVIRNCPGKIREILGIFNDCDSALETHSGIDVALWQRRE